MNYLYGLLISPLGTLSDSEYYKKEYTYIPHTLKSRKIRDALVAFIPEARLPLFACFICHEILDTCFGPEICEFDKNNTYKEVTRDPSKSATDSNLCLWDLTKSAKQLKSLYKWLDEDILDKLVVPEWLEIIGAVCLQMLRETL